MAPVQLHYHPASTPCRAILMLRQAAGLEKEIEKVFVDLATGAQLKEDFIKINPCHCVPTVVDDGFNLWESRPIAIYLIDKLAPDNALFPKDLQKRALIHKMMDFDTTVYKAIGTYCYPRMLENRESSPNEMEMMYQRLNDTIFSTNSYVTGDTMTLADLFMIATCTFPEMYGYYISAEKFPNLAAWVKRMKDSDFYKPANEEFEGIVQMIAAHSKKNPVKVYYHPASTPCRAVLMACEATGIPIEKEFVDLAKNAQMEEDFVKINPNHCVPTIVDNGFTLWESRPITTYLIDKYAPDNALFPKDLQKRALIHKMMDFDNTVYKAIGTYCYPRLFGGCESSPDEMEQMYERLDTTVFKTNFYATGDSVTLADLFMIASCTFPEMCGYHISEEKFPNLGAWVKRMKDSDFYKVINAEYENLIKMMAAQAK